MNLYVPRLGAIALLATCVASSSAVASDLSADDIAVEEPVSMKDTMPRMSLPGTWFVTADPAYGARIMDETENITTKTIDQLWARKNGGLKTKGIYISGLFKGSFMYEKTDTDGSFPILTRFPNHSGTTASRFFIDNAALAITATPTDWLTAFAQLEYHEVRFDHQDELQLRKAYVTIGDLSRSPFYLSFGRKTINFGDFGGYNQFTHNINNHFFRAESDGIVGELGFVNDWMQLTATAITGGRHLRTADTAEDDEINNFAVDGDVFIPLGADRQLRVGGGYLHGSIYNHTHPHHPGPSIKCDADGTVPRGTPTTNVPDCRGRNAAWDVRAEYTSTMFDFMAEYTQTVDPWPATGEHIKAWTVQGRYKTNISGYDTHFTASYSRSEIGQFTVDGANFFEELDQIVGGVEVFINPNFSVGVEYSHNKGFAPLANVTGNANADVEADQVVVGAKLTF